MICQSLVCRTGSFQSTNCVTSRNLCKNSLEFNDTLRATWTLHIRMYTRAIGQDIPERAPETDKKMAARQAYGVCRPTIANDAHTCAVTLCRHLRRHTRSTAHTAPHRVTPCKSALTISIRTQSTGLVTPLVLTLDATSTNFRG